MITRRARFRCADGCGWHGTRVWPPRTWEIAPCPWCQASVEVAISRREAVSNAQGSVVGRWVTHWTEAR